MKAAWASLVARAGILTELIVFLWRGRLWWMIPLVAAALLAAALAALQPMSPLAPLVYPLF